MSFYCKINVHIVHNDLVCTLNEIDCFHFKLVGTVSGKSKNNQSSKYRETERVNKYYLNSK